MMIRSSDLFRFLELECLKVTNDEVAKRTVNPRT